MPRSLATFSFSSQFSFVDSIRRDRLHNTSLHLSTFTRISFFARWSLISRAQSSLSRFPLRDIIFLPSHLPSSFSLVPSRLLQRLRALQRALDLTLSSYVSSILYRHLSHLTARTPFLLSEGHWNRIKLYAGFSMPPFPPVAMKGGIRHGGRFGRRKMGRSRLNEVGRNFLGLLSNVLMQRDNWEKEAAAIRLIDRGKRVKDEKQRFSGRREWGIVTSHCCLPRSRLSGKMNVFGLLLQWYFLLHLYRLAASNGRA